MQVFSFFSSSELLIEHLLCSRHWSRFWGWKAKCDEELHHHIPLVLLWFQLYVWWTVSHKSRLASDCQSFLWLQPWGFLFSFFSQCCGSFFVPMTKAARSVNTPGSSPQQWGGSWWIKSVASCLSGHGSGRPSCNFSGSPCEVEFWLPSHLDNACLYWLFFLYQYPQPLAFASWYHVLE